MNMVNLLIKIKYWRLSESCIDEDGYIYPSALACDVVHCMLYTNRLSVIGTIRSVVMDLIGGIYVHHDTPDGKYAVLHVKMDGQLAYHNIDDDEKHIFEMIFNKYDFGTDSYAREYMGI